jgi:hypothetical protein
MKNCAAIEGDQFDIPIVDSPRVAIRPTLVVDPVKARARPPARKGQHSGLLKPVVNHAVVLTRDIQLRLRSLSLFALAYLSQCDRECYHS